MRWSHRLPGGSGSGCAGVNRSAAALDDAITCLEKEAKNLAKGIAKLGELESLVSELAAVDTQLAEARAERRRLTESGDTAGAFRSVAELATGLDRALRWLAWASRDFADILRRLIPSFVIVPVQGVTGGQVRPRAKVTLSTAAWAAGGGGAGRVDHCRSVRSAGVHPTSTGVRRGERPRPARQPDDPGCRLKLNHMQVKRAMEYHTAMQTGGTSEPYQCLTGPPLAASRWSGKRPGRSCRASCDRRLADVAKGTLIGQGPFFYPSAPPEYFPRRPERKAGVTWQMSIRIGGWPITELSHGKTIWYSSKPLDGTAWRTFRPLECHTTGLPRGGGRARIGVTAY